MKCPPTYLRGDVCNEDDVVTYSHNPVWDCWVCGEEMEVSMLYRNGLTGNIGKYFLDNCDNEMCGESTIHYERCSWNLCGDNGHYEILQKEFMVEYPKIQLRKKKKAAANKIGEWFLNIKYTPAFKYCRDKQYQDLLDIYAEN